jgi:UDP-N-acetylmuramoyl-L-alanyl-D-glutamate--2,6-diaminopimelate ligase
MSLPFIDVENICTHSSDVNNGSLFVAIKGFATDGHNYIQQAIDNGASAIITDKNDSEVVSSIPNIKVENSRSVLSKLAATFYNHPSKELNIVGITGTNGKTTTATILHSIFKENGFKCAQLGTLGTIADGYRTAKTLTTLDPVNLHRSFREFVQMGITHVIMEVSSHALDQYRVSDVEFNVGVFTNLSEEHLDYHKNMKNYFEAKAKLFQMLNASSSAVINYDHEIGLKISKVSKAKLVTVSKHGDTNIHLSGLISNFNGIEFIVHHEGGKIPISSNLIGEYNVENILCAVSIALSQNINPEIIQKGVSRCDIIPGRMEIFKLENKSTIVIDYAHTPDAYEKVLNTVQKMKPKHSKVNVFFGCGGDRDHEKRPVMGRIAENYSDKMWIVPDNPRAEKINDINNQIVKGLNKNTFQLYKDRGKALRKALVELSNGDILVVLGKGREDYQEINGKKINYSDIEIIKGFINAN